MLPKQDVEGSDPFTRSSSCNGNENQKGKRRATELLDEKTSLTCNLPCASMERIATGIDMYVALIAWVRLKEVGFHEHKLGTRMRGGKHGKTSQDSSDRR